MKSNSRPASRLKISFASLCICALAVAGWSANSADAAIVNAFQVTQTAPPANVLPGTVEPTAPYPIVFRELASGFAPAGGIAVDHNGTDVALVAASTANVVSPTLIGSTIPAGTLVESYIFHFDPTTGSPISYASQIEFSQQILGVQLFSSANTSLQKPALTPYTGKLESGDAAVTSMGGPSAAYYPVGLVTRGLEDDAISIDLLRKRISLVGTAFGTEIDQVRILVAVPEPCSLGLVAIGVMGFAVSTVTRIGRNRRS